MDQRCSQVAMTKLLRIPFSIFCRFHKEAQLGCLCALPLFGVDLQPTYNSHRPSPAVSHGAKEEAVVLHASWSRRDIALHRRRSFTSSPNQIM